MIPKTKIQIRVDKLSRHLPALTREQKKWADDSVFHHYYFRTLKKNTCLECGHSWEEHHRIPLDKLLTETCPRCGQVLKWLPNKKRTDRAISYFYTASVVKEFQLLRYYHISRFCKVGFREKIYITEVCQHWIRTDGRRVVRAILHNPQSFHIYDYCYSPGMQVRSNKDNYYYKGLAWPRNRFLHEIRRNGFRGGFHGLHPAFFFQQILCNPQAETLLKSRQYKLLEHLGSHWGETIIHELWPSIRICIRNGYIVKDAQTWIDHMRLLKQFNMDLLSPKYVCPDNLESDHQKLIKRRERAERKKEAEQRSKEIEAYNKVFKKKKSRFFGLSFSNGMISVVVLEDVNDYYLEGRDLNHCVFSSRYFEKPDTLVLSAREKDKRIATIEISLKKWEILQCRGKNNQPPPHYEDILNLVNNNIEQIKKKIRVHAAA